MGPNLFYNIKIDKSSSVVSLLTCASQKQISILRIKIRCVMQLLQWASLALSEVSWFPAAHKWCLPAPPFWRGSWRAGEAASGISTCEECSTWGWPSNMPEQKGVLRTNPSTLGSYTTGLFQSELLKKGHWMSKKIIKHCSTSSVLYAPCLGRSSMCLKDNL